MKLNIQRVTLSGSEYAFRFDNERVKYLVKNFTVGDIYVAFESGATQAESIKIPSMNGQVCCVMIAPPEPVLARTNTIYVTGTGEVEVQQL